MSTTRILVADDHEVVRQGVRRLLEQEGGWVVCGEATTGREALAKAVDLQPDVVVLDASMPEMNGLEATRQIRKALPAKILVLTMHDSDDLLEEFLDAGAQGYLLKSDAGRMLVEGVRAVLKGGIFTQHAPAAATRGKGSDRTAARVHKPERLTQREREILQLLCEGKSNKEIGSVLGISTKTVETHRAHIMTKLHLHSVTDLVRYAIRNRITEA